MKHHNAYLVFSLFYVIIMLSIGYMFIVSHEDVHKQVAIYNGCSSYNISYFPKAYFICYERDRELTDNEVNNEYLLDSLNEIVGYNVSILIVSIMVCVFFICSIMFINKQNKDFK